MPFFEVRLHCSGIDVPINGERARGFFTNRVVRSADPASAMTSAVDLLRREWMESRYFSTSASKNYDIQAEEVNPLGFLQGLLSRRQGYAFHTEEE